ncbi:MAG: L-histidine N(alpha)-methyltransferase [Gemmatimonas sp.]
MSPAATRFRCVRLAERQEPDTGGDVALAFTQRPRTLPCRYFYDARGSELFERITDLAEYYPTRTEAEILKAHANELAALTGACELVELGAGSSRKTRLLIEAYLRRGRTVQFRPVDVSESALAESGQALAERYDRLSIEALVGTYEQGLAALGPAHGRRMLIFLGSTIGNLDDREMASFLAGAADALAPGDFFLLGFDRRKDPAIIEPAYNDAEGVTAAFNLNILRHLNRRFGANFDLGGFRHEAPFVADRSRIEMRLVTRRTQIVRVPSLGIEATLAAGEFIRTEISRKFEPEAILGPTADAGFGLVRLWSDSREWFSLALFQRTDRAA